MKLIIVLALVAIAAAEVKNFKGYKVFRLTPNNEEQTALLHKFTELSDDYNFWNGPILPNVPVDLMVAPEKISEFEEMMRVTGTPYETFIEDVQVLNGAENPRVRNKREENTFNWTRYHTLEEIYDYMDNLALVHSDKVRVMIGGTSFENRRIKGIKLSYGPYKPIIFIEGGIRGREWISTATATYLINELLNSQDPNVRALAESNDWYIFPSVNPDSYVYTHEHDRFWHKTRKPYTDMCVGSDLNRNWAYKWMQGGATSNPCSSSYAGTAPFSEVEAESLSRFIRSISYDLYAYISLHGYAQILHFPYGNTNEHLDNYDQLYAIGKEAIKALSRRFGTRYSTGNTATYMYNITGSSADWVKNTLKVPLVYTYELRDMGEYGFALPADQIVPTGQEVLDSLVTIFEEANIRRIPKKPLVEE